MSFIIATSDGDFTHLAVRLRELGARVIGIGEAKATRMFRASCSSFIELGAQPTVKLVPKVPTGVTELDLKIRAMIAQHSKKGSGMRIAELAPKMHVAHGIKISTLPEKTWRSYLTAHLWRAVPPRVRNSSSSGPAGVMQAPSGGFAPWF